MNWRRLILIAICAAFAFGGSFTCHATQDSDQFTQNPTTGAK